MGRKKGRLLLPGGGGSAHTKRERKEGALIVAEAGKSALSLPLEEEAIFHRIEFPTENISEIHLARAAHLKAESFVGGKNFFPLLPDMDIRFPLLVDSKSQPHQTTARGGRKSFLPYPISFSLCPEKRAARVIRRKWESSTAFTLEEGRKKDCVLFSGSNAWLDKSTFLLRPKAPLFRFLLPWRKVKRRKEPWFEKEGREQKGR